MSFDIQWESICNDKDLAQSLKEFLNSKLSTVELPHYLANLQVVDFHLGDVAPEITIRDIDMPFHEFYVAAYEKEDDDYSGFGDYKGDKKEKLSDYKTSADSKPLKKEDFEFKGDIKYGVNSRHDSPVPNKASTPVIPAHSFHSNSRPPSPHPFINGMNSTGSILMPRTSSGITPTMVHMGVGLGGFGIAGPNVSTPLAVPPPSSGSNMSHVDSESNYFQSSHNNVLSTNDEEKMIHALLRGMNGMQLNRQDSFPSYADLYGSNNEKDELVDYESLDTSLDIQFSVDVLWDSKLYVEVTCDLLVNYPAPGFIKLPVRLKITDLKIHSLLVAAVISKKVFLSFLCDIDDENEDEIKPESATESRQNSRNGAKTRMKRTNGKERIDILQDMKIEGEIGNLYEGPEMLLSGVLKRSKIAETHRPHNPLRSKSTNHIISSRADNLTTGTSNSENDMNDTNGLVLRNISKIENFLTSVFRGMIIDELAWPGWIELDFNDDDDDDDDDDDGKDGEENDANGSPCEEEGSNQIDNTNGNENESIISDVMYEPDSETDSLYH